MTRNPVSQSETRTGAMPVAVRAALGQLPRAVCAARGFFPPFGGASKDGDIGNVAAWPLSNSPQMPLLNAATRDRTPRTVVAQRLARRVCDPLTVVRIHPAVAAFDPFPPATGGPMAFQLFVTAARARALGCTHHAWFMGLIPGFFDPDTSLWVSRSDVLNPIEDALVFLWVTLRELRGEEPDFMFSIGRPL